MGEPTEGGRVRGEARDHLPEQANCLQHGLRPRLHDGEWVFVTAAAVPDGLVPQATFSEPEGLSLLVRKQEAQQAGLPFTFVGALISLAAVSSLDAIGVTAAVASQLAKAAISCNIIAAHYHDHVVVPYERRFEALWLIDKIAAGQMAPISSSAREPPAPPEELRVATLVLRRHRISDAAQIADSVRYSLADLGRWLPWAQAAVAETEAQRRRLEEVVSKWESGEEYVYVIRRSEEERVLGCVALHRRLGPGALEIGYWLRSDETGRGVMTLAAGAVARAALALPGISRVEIHCDQANARSAAVARRLGFALAAVVDASVGAPGEVGRKMIWVMEGPYPPSGTNAKPGW
ncbi:MAG TPA: ACT domain-containing protein [Acidimicrobiales bacterium]|nr:ACT domain-containing protein [Acidimicrobiales bacterium]